MSMSERFHLKTRALILTMSALVDLRQPKVLQALVVVS